MATTIRDLFTPELGSISTATLRLSDLIPCLTEYLDFAKEEIAASAGSPGCGSDALAISVGFWSDVDDLCGRIERERTWAPDELRYYLSDAAGYHYDALCGLMDLLAPDGCYFGGHVGDGADVGFWADED